MSQQMIKMKTIKWVNVYVDTNIKNDESTFIYAQGASKHFQVCVSRNPIQHQTLCTQLFIETTLSIFIITIQYLKDLKYVFKFNNNVFSKILIDRGEVVFVVFVFIQYKWGLIKSNFYNSHSLFQGRKIQFNILN